MSSEEMRDPGFQEYLKTQLEDPEFQQCLKTHTVKSQSGTDFIKPDPQDYDFTVPAHTKEEQVKQVKQAQGRKVLRLLSEWLREQDRRMAAKPWHERYEYCLDQLLDKKEQYEERCSELGMTPIQTEEEPRRELIARIVRESNWQEDYYLTVAETRELAEAVFDDLITMAGPHLDMNGVVATHKQQVIQLKREKKTPEQIAAFNLSRAHVALGWIRKEQWCRFAALAMPLMSYLKAGLELLPEGDAQKKVLTDGTITFMEERMETVRTCSDPLYGPLNLPVDTIGKLIEQLPKADISQTTEEFIKPQLFPPLPQEYIHFSIALLRSG